jgi:succinate dehydrogenase/fumarate reductase cytochrome b subunit
MLQSQHLRVWHKRNAAVLIIFLAAHFTTHLSAIFGPDTHSSVIETLRIVYRNPIIEIILIGLFVTQVGLGIRLVIPRLKQTEKSGWFWIQVISGLYLAMFILIHVFMGILRGRGYEGADTGFYFAASTLVTEPVKYGFIPYYGLGVIALFSHLAAALHWAGKPRAVTHGLIALGIAVSILVVGAYGGLFFQIDRPEAYQAYIRDAV